MQPGRRELRRDGRPLLVERKKNIGSRTRARRFKRKKSFMIRLLDGSRGWIRVFCDTTQ